MIYFTPLHNKIQPPPKDNVFHNHNHKNKVKTTTTFNHNDQGSNDIIKKLHSCSKAGKAKQAEQYLKIMQSLYEQGDMAMRPDFRHYNSLMHAWVKSNLPDKEYHAQTILEWMCNLQKKAGTSPGANVNANANAHLRPTTISFNICINAWRSSKERHSTDVAWYLFELMTKMSEEGQMAVGPDYHTCKVILHSLSNRVVQGTSHKAERILKLMHESNRENCKPDASIYNQIMHIYSFNKEENAPIKGEELITDMHERFLAGDECLKPSTLTFNSLLNTYAKSNIEGAAERSQTILEHMQEMYESGFESVQPDVISFNTVINAHASSNKQGSEHLAYNILSKMKELHATGRVAAVPNSRTFNVCIKACISKSARKSIEENEMSMDLACNLLTQMYTENVRADEHTYHWFFKACESLCLDALSLTSRVQWGHQMCYNSGILNDRILRQIQTITNKAQESYHYDFNYHSASMSSNVSSGNDTTSTSASTYQHTESSNESWTHSYRSGKTHNEPIAISSARNENSPFDDDDINPDLPLSLPQVKVSLPSIISVDGSPSNMWAYESPQHTSKVDNSVVNSPQRTWSKLHIADGSNNRMPASPSVAHNMIPEHF